MDAIFSTLIGGMLALFGAMVGPYFQRKHDRWLATKADHGILRTKAEELFSELSNLTAQSGRASVRTLERLRDDTLEAVPLPDLSRIRALSTVYFPQLLPHIDAFEGDIKALFDKLVPQIGKAGEAANAGEIKALGVVMVIEHQQIATKLVKAVQKEMIEITPKFEDLAK
jgi:hypothetical protein